MVKADLAVRKISRAKSWLDDAEEILARPAEEFLADVKSRDLRSTMTSLSRFAVR